MKTIKELEAKGNRYPIYREDMAYLQALKDVLKLIDEFFTDNLAMRIDIKLMNELKERIDGNNK